MEAERKFSSFGEDSIMAHFQSHLVAYLDGIQDRLGADGERWNPSPERRILLTHMEWLVRNRCLDKSLSEIAKDEYRARKTVSEPVATLSNLLGLPPYRHRPGHPPGHLTGRPVG